MVVPIGVSADDGRMTGEVFFAEFQAKCLCLFHGQAVVGCISWVEADDILMALNITMLGVLTILAVCQQTGCCKREIAALKRMDMILKTTDLCKNFKGQMAVNNVSLNIRRNSVYGLLGPNGAGKSTILKMLTGILRPTSGSIEFDGHPWKRNDLEHIGALIEMPPLYENLTAYENLKVRTTLLGLDDARINEVLQIVQLTNTGKKRAGQFSLGMKQRLGIAIALLNSPQLLILDEPTNGLDPLGIEELRELIRSFPSNGITVILSSHILSEVQQIADHVGIIAGGVLGYEGELRAGEDLEQLFMDVIRRNGKEGY